MTLQELRFIVILARERHFGKAAAACFITQPTLSIAVRKLEENLGVILFERNKNEVRVTPIGEKIIEQAQSILDEVDVLKRLVESDQDHIQGIFKLGVIYTVGPYLLPQLIKQLNQLAPLMLLEIHEDFTENLREKLASGELDAIVISLPFTGVDVVKEVLYSEPFVVLMPEDHPLAHAKSIDEKELAEYNMLLLDEKNCLREQVISSCPSCFTANKVHHELNWRTIKGSSLETIRHMVASGMGLTILPITAANMDLSLYQHLVYRHLNGAAAKRSVALVWRRTFPRREAIEILLQSISQCALPGIKK